MNRDHKLYNKNPVNEKVMSEITITFPDGAKKKYRKGVTVESVAKSISEGLARATLGATYNNEHVHFDTKLNEDGKLKLITFKDKDG